LQPGASDSINQRVFHIPKNLLAGTYYLAACADANNTVVELDENNNCSFSKIEGHQSFIVPMQKIKSANGNGDEEDDEDEDHHDGRDSSKGKDGWKNPFGKPEVKR
jgi:CARDB